MILRPQGYVCVSYSDGPVVECDTMQCGHCKGVMHFWVDPTPLTYSRIKHGGGCYTCGRQICEACVKRDRCDPWEEKIERIDRTLDFDRWFLEALR